MTSMPASRSARAMIFAPRSCPSSPGFATTTRILRLDSGLSAAVSVVACIKRRTLSCRGDPLRAARKARGIVSAGELPGGLDRCGALRFERALGEPAAQDLLVELAHARLRDRLDEGEL